MGYAKHPIDDIEEDDFQCAVSAVTPPEYDEDEAAEDDDDEAAEYDEQWLAMRDEEEAAAIMREFNNPDDSMEVRMLHAPPCIKALSYREWSCVGWHEAGWNMVSPCELFCVSVFGDDEYGFRATLEVVMEEHIGRLVSHRRGRTVVNRQDAPDAQSAYLALMNARIGAVSIATLLGLPSDRVASIAPAHVGC
jgi:hypothetical protein